MLTGHLERSLSPDPSKEETHCRKYTDDRKGQLLKGMEIIRGVRPAQDPWWEGGRIFDPDNGNTTSCGCVSPMTIVRRWFVAISAHSLAHKPGTEFIMEEEVRSSKSTSTEATPVPL